MGRWSQYRHRGRGNPSPPAFIDAPVFEVDWDAFQDVVDLDGLGTGPFPAGASKVEMRFRLQFATLWTAGNYASDGETILLTTPTVPGQVWEVQARWVDGATDPLSDWSASAFVTIT